MRLLTLQLPLLLLLLVPLCQRLLQLLLVRELRELLWLLALLLLHEQRQQLLLLHVNCILLLLDGILRGHRVRGQRRRMCCRLLVTAILTGCVPECGEQVEPRPWRGLSSSAHGCATYLTPEQLCRHLRSKVWVLLLQGAEVLLKACWQATFRSCWWLLYALLHQMCALLEWWLHAR